MINRRTQDYKDFSLRLHEKGASRPIAGQFELTYRCNLRCQHCYIVNDPKRKELSFKEICRILDEVRQEGCLWLCLTGGEPLLREDFWDIYSYAHKKGFILTIFTNATLLNEELAKRLKRFPPFCIEVTLNGASKKAYELITQTPGSFKKAMAGISLIRKYKIHLKLKSQAMALNIKDLPLLRKFYNKTGAAFRFSVLIDPRIDGARQPCSLRLPVEKILKGFALGRVNSGQECRISKDEQGHSAKLFRCPGGSWQFYVNPFGELLFCNLVRKPSWDLRRHSFRRGFYEFYPRISSLKFKTGSPCRSCRLRNACLWCPGRAYLETGHFEKPVEYYCKLAKMNENILRAQ